MSDINPPPSVLASEAAILEYFDTLPEGTELTESHIHALHEYLESKPDLEPLDPPLGQGLTYSSSMELTSSGQLVRMILDKGPSFLGDAGPGKLCFVTVRSKTAAIIPGWTTIVGSPRLKGTQYYHLTDAALSAMCTTWDPESGKWSAHFVSSNGKYVLHDRPGTGEWVPNN
ncbi:hypothetical protein FRC09_015953 [Ceratobasidium sp. 395]|nr:hypothetical protein FRC09_015953 [Ceratobasidium sp. 395]